MAGRFNPSELRHLVGFHDHGISINRRVAIFKTFIRPKWEYGLSLCRLTKSNFRPLESLQHGALCRLLSFSGKTNAALVRLGLGLDSVFTRATCLQAGAYFRLLRRRNTATDIWTFVFKSCISISTHPADCTWGFSGSKLRTLLTRNPMTLSWPIDSQWKHCTLFRVFNIAPFLHSLTQPKAVHVESGV
jgi:hypothetical protein